MSDQTPSGDITLDAATLRVLAHPMRLTLLEHLRQRGPATARQLAAHYEIDSGAASYHLRRLAEGGLIEEDLERGTRRDRWWRARHRSSVHQPADSDPDERQDSRAYLHAVVLAYSEQLRRLAYTAPLLPDEWYEASMFSNYTLRLTPAELNDAKSELAAVVKKYRDRDNGAGVPVALQLHAFPLLEPDDDA
ncbi:DNA-binding transcriptional ArsR family regulator [Kribbella aluminosa]|uniref:DNA-binding transcriptional ArsR family regulator n=1 Tax=Kribbella aluminosa TaxID=416017 RepID=A0ABS4UHV7_9ACTN|nr:helix-turn-helix domain-containing protein [Kribbella aluminosa]MBP2351205.1 DNA-binding transcriptional ArsR family regulator [Kribbella aluminosa]